VHGDQLLRNVSRFGIYQDLTVLYDDIQKWKDQRQYGGLCANTTHNFANIAGSPVAEKASSYV